MNVWRVAVETRQYRADDLSGKGAAAHQGRWNADGVAIVYAATSISLATLETAAHLGRKALPMNRFLLRIQVPEEVWAEREVPATSKLPASWMSLPAGAGSVAFGSAWVRAMSSAVLLVPSVVVSEEQMVLINPGHPDAKAIRARVIRPFEYDRLFRDQRR